MTDTLRYRLDCDGLLMAIRTACTPRPQEDQRYPLTLTIAYYGEPVGAAVWFARYVMRRARAIGLYPTTAQIEAQLRKAA